MKKVMGAGSGNLDSVSPIPHHLPKLPFKEGGRTLPKGRGLTLTSDLGLECQPVKISKSTPFPKGKVSSELFFQVKAGSLSTLFPAVECLAGTLLRNKGCDLHMVA